jgi:TolB protein
MATGVRARRRNGQVGEHTARARRGDRALVAPAIALVGLVVAAIVSMELLSFGVLAARPTGPGAQPEDPAVAPPVVPGQPGQTRGPLQERTPDPSVIITPRPEERVEVRGTLLFARTGNIWAASGLELRQLSNRGTDSSPAWDPDGSHVYFIETRSRRATAAVEGGTSGYTLEYPVIMRMAADGSDRTEIRSGLYRRNGGHHWFYWLLQPDVSPDGERIAVVSDAPEGIGDIKLGILPADGGTVEAVPIRSIPGLGHNDPAWSPDGTRIAFTYNSREGNLGTPHIGIYSLQTGKMKLFRNAGFAAPSWSPDGRFIAAERTNGRGRDIVILDSRNGLEVARLTNDGRSFAPAYSPDGTQIAYLQLRGQRVDLRVVTFQETSGAITLLEDKAITEDGSLDAGSPPAWYVPPESRQEASPGPGTSPAP